MREKHAFKLHCFAMNHPLFLHTAVCATGKNIKIIGYYGQFMDFMQSIYGQFLTLHLSRVGRCSWASSVPRGAHCHGVDLNGTRWGAEWLSACCYQPQQGGVRCSSEDSDPVAGHYAKQSPCERRNRPKWVSCTRGMKFGSTWCCWGVWILCYLVTISRN